ncbi:MAG TPA: hypothetical protein PK771_04735, partial [Spirochaetota bacterium]|nr:hypothetical protein [Spirochaetota bacterium]
MIFPSRIFIFLLFFLFVTKVLFGSDDVSSDKKIVKRNIAILLFYNLKKDNNDFYSNLLRDTLKSNLMAKNIFKLVEFSEINNGLEKLNLNLKDINIDEKKASFFAETLKADIVLFGTFAV